MATCARCTDVDLVAVAVAVAVWRRREACKLSQDLRKAEATLAKARSATDRSEGQADILSRVWLSSSASNWREWRGSWGEWLSLGVFWGSHGFDVLAADAFREALSLGAGTFVTKKKRQRGLLTEQPAEKMKYVHV